MVLEGTVEENLVSGLISRLLEQAVPREGLERGSQ